MTKLLFIWLLLIAQLSSNEREMVDVGFIDNDYALTEDTNESNQTYDDSHLPKVLYLSYKDIQKRAVNGEIISVTIKTLPTVQSYSDVKYEFLDSYGLELINEVPERASDAKSLYDTFHFLVTQSKAKLPDFRATLENEDGIIYRRTTLPGEMLNVITLNPKDDFSNIIANSFELIGYKTTTYDKSHNIVIFVATAENCDMKAFELKNVFSQGIESITESHLTSRITYYAIIEKEIENFSFSYFNLVKNKFILVNIPIIVTDDSVTTQSDLKPRDQSRERLKMAIAAGVALIGFLIILWRKKYIYLLLIIIPLIYIITIAAPSKDVCIKQGAEIHLLPVHNGTIFESTQTTLHLPKEGNVKEFVKVKLHNEKIGWVKNEDICSY